MTCLQDVFSVTIFRFLRRLQDVLRDVYKTSWKTKNCYAEGALKTSSRHVLKTFWRRLEDQQMFSGSYITHRKWEFLFNYKFKVMLVFSEIIHEIGEPLFLKWMNKSKNKVDDKSVEKFFLLPVIKICCYIFQDVLSSMFKNRILSVKSVKAYMISV